MPEPTDKYIIIYKTHENSPWRVWVTNNDINIFMTEDEALEEFAVRNTKQGVHAIRMAKVI